MPVPLLLGSITYGAFFGFFPIAWIVFWAVVLYRITVETGKFEIVKESVGSVTRTGVSRHFSLRSRWARLSRARRDLALPLPSRQR
jgi:hypothetical protein